MPNPIATITPRGVTRSDESMRTVCCWCAPAHTERLSMRDAGTTRFGICEDCLEERLDDLQGVTLRRRARLTTAG